MENKEFDTLGRIIHHVEPVTGMLYEYKYIDDNSRIETITNENNKSNFKTIKKQIEIDGEYIDVEIQEFGDTYNILKKYEGKNRETYYERTNMKTGKIFKKKTKWKEEKIQIWSTEYDGEGKSIGFRMAKEIMTGLTNNIK